MRRHAIGGGAAAVMAAGTALGQAGIPALFVGNNGNLDGSVTTLSVDGDAGLAFVAEARANTNASSVGLSPDGRLLAIGRTSGDDDFEELRIFEVGADGSLSLALLTLAPDTPIDLAWLSNSRLAILETNLGAGQFNVRTYEFTGGGLVELDAAPTGGFTSSVEARAGSPILYTGRTSGGSQIRAFAVGPDGSLELVQALDVGTFPIDLTLSPDGGVLYTAGGISSGGDKIAAYLVSPATGMLTPIAGSPFTSPGASPAHLALTGDGGLLIAGHGTDATVRTFFVGAGGGLTPTGFSFDVGLQGSIGSVAALGDLVFVTDDTSAIDGVTGVYQFRAEADGSLTPIGRVTGTMGTAPTELAAWSPGPVCAGDATGDGVVDSADLNLVLGAFGARVTPGSPGDLDADGIIGSADLNEVLAAFGGPCA